MRRNSKIVVSPHSMEVQDSSIPAAGNCVNSSVKGFKEAQTKAAVPFGSSLGGALAALLILTVLYGSFGFLSLKAMFMEFVVPLSSNAPLERFAEGRAMDHILALAGDNVLGRQEGSSGLDLAANYITDQVKSLEARASSGIRFEVDESYVNGSFNLRILTHSVSFAYRNHRNIAVRISAKDAPEDAAAMLLNAHFDAPLGSPGASDCASCVASLIETLRQIIDSGWVPPAPVIFLFNGAEELFLLGAHGFMTTHKWRASIGAVINVEASGACGPDLVVQSGPGSWPSRVYYESAVYPMANSVAQDIFPLIPGDTDYRIFSQDFGDIPGLDIVWILKGTVYHTPYDRPEIIVPGALQARGDNLVALVRGFTTAPELKGAIERSQIKEASRGQPTEHRAVFFDIWGKWMVFYPHNVAAALHLLPLAMVCLVPSLTSSSASGLQSVGARVHYLLQGVVIQAIGLLLAVLFPAILAILRLSVSKTALTWFAQPWIALFLFVPSALAGLLIPRVLWTSARLGAGVQQESLDWAGHWGAVGLSAVLTAVITLSGGAGYLDFIWAIFLIPALPIMRFFQRFFGQQSLLVMVGYLLPATLPMAYSVYFGGVLVQFVAEKAGMTGSIPLPAGFYVSDVIMAVLLGAVVATSVGPVFPVTARWIGKPHLIRLLLYISIGAAALSSRAFPYSYESPKRLVLQRTFLTAGESELAGSRYDFASIDSNPVSFIWKHVPNVAESLHLTEAQRSRDIDFDPVTFTALYPITRMLTRGTSVPIVVSTNLNRRYPQLQVISEDITLIPDGQKRRIYFELNLGDLEAVWGAVMNITGPIKNWSFADQKLAAPENVPGGPPSYICRLSGHNIKESWQFWIEASSSTPLRIEISVLDQQLDLDFERLVTSFPRWVAVVAGTSYLSTYIL